MVVVVVVMIMSMMRGSTFVLEVTVCGADHGDGRSVPRDGDGDRNRERAGSDDANAGAARSTGCLL